MPPEAPFASQAAPAPLRSSLSSGGQAERPAHKPSTPYGIQPTPPGLVRAPGAPMDGGVAPPPPAAPPAKAAEPAPPPQASPPLPAAAPPPPPPSREEPLWRAEAAPSAQPGPAKKGRARGWRFLRRHERFCMAYVLGGNATRAAWDAGYSPAHGGNQGYRLLKRPEIQARIAEIQRGFGRSFAGDVEVLLGKLESAYGQAVAGGYYNAAARIVEVQARIAGHLKNRIAPPASVENGENDDK